MGKAWNRGLTKYTHPSVLKISETMKRRKINNFSKWMEKMKKLGKIKSAYPELPKNGDLAELIGVVLGDGHIGIFPRSESLLIFSNSNNPGFVKRYAALVERIFDKKPAVKKQFNANCIRISIYEKNISNRLNIPSGARKNRKIIIPKWISQNEEYIIRYLRGLYEAEGSLCIHKPTGTYKFLFSNLNTSMLDNVFLLLKKLGFHPHSDKRRVQISRKEEVYKFNDLIKFREY